jgi:pimeloyl-ACP methyl ester carboxylesterase
MRFVFVHGAFHGAWCWERVIAEVTRLGHRGLAVDLPDHSAAGIDTVLDVIEPDDVLVGHSLGGVMVSAVGAQAQLAHLAYVSAFVPDEAGIFEFPAIASLAGAVEIDATGAARLTSDAAATAAFYGNCSAEDAAWACSQLRPQPIREVPVVRGLGDVAVGRTYVLCRSDEALPPDLQRTMAARLGVEPVEIDGDHSPFLGRPAELAGVLVAQATGASE